MHPEIDPDPRLHPSLKNAVRIPRDPAQITDDHLASIFGGDVVGALMEIYRLGPYRVSHPAPLPATRTA